MNIFKYIRQFLYSDAHKGVEQDMQFWRMQICDAVLYIFSFFGLFTLIPSVILSIREGMYSLSVISTIIYLFCVFMTFNRKIKYLPRVISLSIMYYSVGLFLLLLLGPRGAGEIWIFSSTLLTALLLGNTGAFTVFAVNIAVQMFIYIMLRFEQLEWSLFEINHEIWFVKGINFILLNFVIVLANAIFIKGFRTVVSRSLETRNASIIGLAKLAEHRDNDTGNHLKRIQTNVELLALELAKLPKYKKYITPEYIKDLCISSILHDIGKVGIQDAILLKPSSLSEDEFNLIKQHPEIGSNVISEIEKNIQGRSLYSLGKEIALCHHEKWDGSGYPAGLKGESIPLSARIIALADVYDALVSIRPYKEALSHDEALVIISQSGGSHFDPDIVEAFERIASNVKDFIRNL